MVHLTNIVINNLKRDIGIGMSYCEHSKHYIIRFDSIRNV